METEELRARGAQELNKRLDSLRGLFRLAPSAPKRRAGADYGRFFFDAGEIDPLASLIRARLPETESRLRARAEKILERRFDLLGYENLDFGREIDWSLEPVSGRVAPLVSWPSVPYLDPRTVGDHKVTWELGRHQHLTALARAWRLTGQSKLRDEAIRQWRDWRAKNPYPKGIHWTSALEVAFRSISWLWLWALLDREGPEAQSIHRELEDACGHSGHYLERYLSTYFSPNTHLLGEAVALYALGQVFRSFEPAERWRETGRRIVLEEAERQVRGDGLYFEQSLYYHVYAIDFLIFFRILGRRNGDNQTAHVDGIVERMADMLMRLSQGGAPPRFGDDDGGRLFDASRNRAEHMLDPLATAALLYARADFEAAAGGLREETLWLLGPGAGKHWDALVPSPPKPKAARQDESGWHVLVSAEQPPRTLILDAGPLGALAGGHGHADALSVQSIYRGRHWLTDPGTGRYPQDSPHRDAFRSTAAHSTLTVDTHSQAEPAGPFAWKSMPEAVTEHFLDGRMLDLVVARHHGYDTPPRPIVHRRWALLLDHGLIFVRDIASGPGRHKLEQVWRIGPEFRIEALIAGEVLFATEQGDLLSCVSPKSPIWTREIFEGDFSPAYGAWHGAPIVQFSADTETPCERALALAHGRAEATRPRSLELTIDGHGQHLSVYRYLESDLALTLCFRDRAEAWQFGRMRSDASLLAWERSATNSRLLAAFGSFLEVEGERVFEAPDAVERFEWSAAAGVEASAAGLARTANIEPLEALDAELAAD